jgi:hypothetical protein
LKQRGEINKLREELKKSLLDQEYLHKHRSVYSKEQVETWRRDAEGLKERVEASIQQRRLLIDELEQAKRRIETISDESYARGLTNGTVEATRNLHQ